MKENLILSKTKQGSLRREKHKLFFLVLAILFFNLNQIWSANPLASSLSQQNEIEVKGVVTDTKTGEPLPGVSILVKGTTSGTITDLDGNYKVNTSADATLVFTFMGYIKKEIAVNNNTVINITLEEDIVGLDEVVVVGYGIQKKSDITGAVASVSGSDIAKTPVIGVDQALQGRAAGVSITQNTGKPGGSTTIQIRGISSINGTEPLVIVDGVRSSLNNLNPGDIESVEVLKDAASAAIYGSTGGNGVILVTTKKGKTGELSTNINYYRGVQTPWKKMEMCNTEELIDVNNYINYMNTGSMYADSDTLGNYDWQDIMFRKAIMENLDVNFSGGTEKSSYYFSANYMQQEGILRKSDYERIAFRINSDHKLSKLFKVGENVQFTKTKTFGYDEWVYQDEYNSPIVDILTYYPYYGDYDANGDWIVSSRLNPKVEEDILDRTRQLYSVGGNAYVDITPFKGLTITSRINSYTNFNVVDRFYMTYEYNQQNRNENSQVDKSINQQWGWELQEYANYNLTLAEAHNINVMAGFESQYTEMADMSGLRYNLINETPEMRYFNASLNDTNLTQLVEGTGWIDKMYSYFGRLNYDYKGKYLLSLNIRNDNSSRFGPEYRSGTFPSWSIGWKFSEEDFIKDLGIFSFGKIRIGRGNTGANAPARYAYYASVNTTVDAYSYNFENDIVPSSGANLVSIPNLEMHWETMVMTNIGLDLAFLDNKLTATADYFIKESEGMLAYQTLPGIAGVYQFSSHVAPLGGDARPLVNIGTMQNKGIEISLGYKKMEGDLKASFDINTTFLSNEVIDLPEDSILRGRAGVNLSNFCLTAIGQPVSQFYTFETDGVYQIEDARIEANGDYFVFNQPYFINDAGDTSWYDKKALPGDVKIVDQNGDGRINEADKKIVGSPIPKLILGFSTNLEYKGIDLNIFFEGKFGHQIFNGSKSSSNLFNQDLGPNRLKIATDQYRLPLYDTDGNVVFEGNTDTDLPIYNTKNYSKVIDYFVEDGSYLRLKNIQLGYTLPAALTGKAGVDIFRIYVGAKNLLTFTKYTGFDPEISTGNVLSQGVDPVGYYPQSVIIMGGVNIKF
ncbi:MAG: TonB-dependent receptor [Bacteroidales bacterium]|nr:TonB-dependent receptor [Bacteroidales bacterium]